MYNALRIFFFGLAGKIRFLFGICFLVTLFSLYFFFTNRLQDSREDATREKLACSTSLIYAMVDLHLTSSLEHHLAEKAAQIRGLAAEISGNESGGASAQNRLRASLTSPAFTPQRGENVFILDLNGRVLIHNDRAKEKRDLGELPVIKEALREREGVLHYLWLEENQDTNRKELKKKLAAFTYFAPWQMLIWVSSDISAPGGSRWETELRERLAITGTEEDITTFIMDREETLILAASPGADNPAAYSGLPAKQLFEGTQAPESKPGDPAQHGSILPAVKPQPLVRTRFYTGENPDIRNPRNRLAAYAYYPDRDWVILTSTPAEKLYTTLANDRKIVFLIGLIAFLCTSLVISGALRLILKPATEIKKGLTGITAGKLNTRLEVYTRDELGEIADQFNNLLDSFEAVLKEIRHSSVSLFGSVHGLSVSAQEISSTSNQQAASVKEIVSTMEDSDTLAKSIADKINDVAYIAARMKETIDNGFSIIKSSLTQMDGIKSSNSDTIIGIQALSEKIGSIWEIVNIINGIADQTRIIAFNAELEASAAGDAGKNFQIVATEIRRLADSTVTSTNEIRVKINEIQQSSDSLILASEEGTNRIREGWNLSNELQQVFVDILQSSEVSASSAEQIAQSVGQQVSAFEQILLTLRQISEGIDNFVDSVRATTTESDKLKEMADKLNRTITRYIPQNGDDLT